MAEAVNRLIAEMGPDMDAWLAGEDIDLEMKYRTAIDTAGAVPFMAGVFRRYGDATLSGWLFCLIFIWKDFPFAAWKQILYEISGDTAALYQFVPFVTEFLAVDIVRVIHEDPAVSQTARIFAAQRFPKGGPAPGSDWVRETLHDRGVDVNRLWDRLAGEGAPMKNRGEPA